MTQPYYNDQGYIAEGFILDDDYISQTAQLAFFKINSYKLSLVKSSFRETRKELKKNLRETLFNYTNPTIILADTGFFSGEYEN